MKPSLIKTGKLQKSRNKKFSDLLAAVYESKRQCTPNSEEK